MARKKPEIPADVPPACKIRVQGKGTIDQRDHCVEVLAEIGQSQGGIDNDVRIVAGDL